MNLFQKISMSLYAPPPMRSGSAAAPRGTSGSQRGLVATRRRIFHLPDVAKEMRRRGVTAIGRWWNHLIPYKSIAQAEQIQTPLTPEMARALTLWYDLYRNEAPWKESGKVKSLNLAALTAGEIARQVTVEMGWDIQAPGEAKDGKPAMNPRAEYLKAEFGKLIAVLRLKLEQGCAAGGMIVKPCVNPEDGHICFDWAMDWGIYPLAFDDDGGLSDVIIPDVYREGNTIYTRLERHTLKGGDVLITQRAFKSTVEDSLGSEIPLTSVDRWAALPPEATVAAADGMLFGWYRVAAANTVDVGSPLGASVYARGVELLKEIDIQYSRLLWEFEGGELAVDVDPTALMPRQGATGLTVPKLNERLFRAVDTGAENTYEVFAPTLRDASLINGLNQLLIRYEDLCGLSRGTFSDANVDARTATELKIVKQRSYATIADNQKALEKCLRDVLRAMDKYATIYHLAPEGEWEATFDWDDSVVTDAGAQLQERLLLVNSGIISKAELRQWYLGETEAQALAALQAIRQENKGVGSRE